MCVFSSRVLCVHCVCVNVVLFDCNACGDVCVVGWLVLVVVCCFVCLLVCDCCCVV